jgi:hypothetical protein
MAALRKAGKPLFRWMSKTEDSVTLTQLVLLVVGSTSLLFLVRIFHCGPAGSLLYHSIHSLASIDLIIYAT